MKQLLPELTPLLIGTVAFVVGLTVTLWQRKRLHLKASQQTADVHSSAA